MTEATDLRAVAEWMKKDWNERARQDAEHFVYTRDSQADEADFDASGRANYDQLVRPYLPVLLNGAEPRVCRVLEIGCGVGRMTRWFAENFGEAHGLDIAPEMVARARARLARFSNLAIHAGSGVDLQPLPDHHFDLVFSYIVFQHIPSADVIRNYIREAARVLKPGGAFKFQVNGDQSDAYRAHVRDTWLGETLSRDQVNEMLESAGLTLASLEDPGTQYFVVTARKGAGPDRRTYFLPGEPEDGGWRPVAQRSTITLHSPGGSNARLYAAMYFWPGDPHQRHSVSMTAGGAALPPQHSDGPGDHFLEWTLPPHAEGPLQIEMEIAPACAEPHWPALRIVGIATSPAS
ncbi:MAG: class I SAM-dependent methyltransferase [Acidobacteria bacterium]|nr:class I SAM-dependent methyltransferase [Acidobacteriota bacterium]